MSRISKHEIIYDLGMGNLGGGYSLYAKNVIRNNDYATLVTLDGVHSLDDAMVINLDMNKGFDHPNAIDQVKKFLLAKNPNITFAN
ncbi:hypothetical protein [Acinetobacter sp. P1(2025)]|uniref:hypothetical protein n=1 Tax=Acinetobacter sp. P1(2025) TaxID=3446120 RepID=UPI003F53C321